MLKCMRRALVALRIPRRNFCAAAYEASVTTSNTLASESVLLDMEKPAQSKTKCSGCGVKLQSSEPGGIGYIPAQVQDTFASGWKRKFVQPTGVAVDFTPPGEPVFTATSARFREVKSRIMCQRCYCLQHNHCLPEDTSLTPIQSSQDEDDLIKSIVSRIPQDSLILKIVDVLDFESSLAPKLFEALKQRGLQVIFAVNKCDALPVERRDLHHVKEWARRLGKHIRHASSSDVVLISALTGYGFRELEDTLRKHMSAEKPKNLYVLGRANSGKSAFVNRFLKFIGFKNFPTVDLKTGVGGLTRAPLPGTTADFVKFSLPRNFQVFDTPGLPLSSGSALRTLSRVGDFFALAQKLKPLTMRIREGYTLIVGGLAQISINRDCVVVAFFSQGVSIQICATIKAPRVVGDGRFAKPAAATDFGDPQDIELFGGNSRGFDDLSIAGLGWVSISTPGFHRVTLHLPEGVRAFRRPAMLPGFVRKSRLSTPSELARSAKP